MSDLWAAPYVGEEPFAGESIRLPASKSLMNRLLVLASLADGSSALRNPLVARDTTLMAEALRALGATIDHADAEWTITPGPAVSGRVTIDCGLAGTVMRFVPPLAALSQAAVTFDGDARARERPMSTTIESLRGLGVPVDSASGRLPFTVHGMGRVTGHELSIDASASSQFVSALLLAAPRFPRGLMLHHAGASLPSQPHIDMTIAELRKRGVVVDDSVAGTWRVESGPIKALDVSVEPDLSNAGPFIGAALVTGRDVPIADWPADTTQAGDAWRTIAAKFGGSASDDGTFIGPGSAQIAGVELDLHDVGELTPVVAAVAAFAHSECRLTGIAHLRGHETDRLKALATEINGLGGDVEETDDGLIIRPRPLHGGVFHTYDDHRMVHAAAVVGLRVPGVLVENAATTAKTYPGFIADWERFARA
ncbi:MAG TPA: 3-phosphoshikimate 1-carboxyvinyltransferase [Aeromicrobium sp.]|nr:3-phosphoshikimate 1-carboxyvinyltransferase [Aeromicrobium sp.]